MTEEVTEKKGAFIESLTRKSNKIRADRAAAISEDADLIYKRIIEDLEVDIRRLERERESMLDLSPDNSLSLKPAKDFDEKEFVEQDVQIGLKLRNLNIKLDIAKKRYMYLFSDQTEGGKA